MRKMTKYLIVFKKAQIILSLQDRINSYNIIFLNMASHQEKLRLPILLSQIDRKLKSFFIKKLILFQQQSPVQSKVTNYDLECEGIYALTSFFRTKQQNLLFKAFSIIKQNITVQPARVAPVTQKGNNGTTRRTYLNSTITASDSSPIKEIFCRTIRSLKSEKGQNSIIKSQANKSSVDLEKLLNKVKLTNSRNEGMYSFREQNNITKDYNSRQNYSYCIQRNSTPRQLEQRYKTNPSQHDQNEGNYYSYYKSQIANNRNSRRQFILDKFNQIENNMQELCGGRQVRKPQLSNEIIKEIHNIKQKLRINR